LKRRCLKVRLNYLLINLKRRVKSRRALLDIQFNKEKLETLLSLGAVHKIRPQSAIKYVIKNCPLRTRGRKVFQMRTSARFGAKASDFLKFMMCPHGRRVGGLSQCGRGRGQFSRFCTGGLLLFLCSLCLTIFYKIFLLLKSVLMSMLMPVI